MHANKGNGLNAADLLQDLRRDLECINRAIRALEAFERGQGGRREQRKSENALRKLITGKSA